jgi:para-aminobenzoate synthetase component 1
MKSLFMRSFQSELDPYILYSQMNLPDDCIFLDSSKKDSLYSHYSIIGLNPFLTIKVVKGKIYEKIYPNTDFSLLAEKNVFAYLNRLITEHHIDNTTSYPFIGGGIGYFSYELGKAQQHIASSTQNLFTLPECYFVFYDNLIILDLKKQEGLITGLGKIKPGDLSTHEIQSRINTIELTASSNLFSKSSPKSNATSSVFNSTFTRQAYMKAIDRMRNYMEDGHIYVANMTHTFHGPCHQAASIVYEGLRRINPAPFSAYLPLDGFQVCCSSPERFIQVHNKQVQTRPIKGTVPRGETHALDQKNRKQLEQSTKDKAELLMIVDLERNDLSRVCQPNSVHVPELFKIESFSSVYHLVSTVTGLLKDGKTSVDCLEATFPGGSITGAPKIRAMEIIEELERTSRQIYTGSIGYFGFDGSADFNIVIRSIVIKDNQAYIGVGGGITYESDPVSEFQETLDKAKNLFSALNATVNIDEF